MHGVTYYSNSVVFSFSTFLRRSLYKYQRAVYVEIPSDTNWQEPGITSRIHATSALRFPASYGASGVICGTFFPPSQRSFIWRIFASFLPDFGAGYHINTLGIFAKKLDEIANSISEKYLIRQILDEVYLL
jgi:hypothetical protein